MINTLIKEKKDLRKLAMDKRCSMAISGEINLISSLIITKILNSDDFKKAKHIGLYFPIKNEIDLTSLLKIKTKKFYFPKCKENSMDFCLYENKNSIEYGLYNIPEPKGKSINPNILDVIYIPALMANKYGYRLGYGKGYYDRFFKKYSLNAKKIIVVPYSLISDDFIQDDFDYKCDMILCEK